MEQEKFNLSWNEFQSSIGKSLSKIHKDKHFADVTLACDDGKQIEAHKVILSSSSSFFRNILLNNPHQHPLLYLKGVKFHNLQSLLQFMYLGQTEVGQGHLEEFMITANDLKVEGLMEKGNNEEGRIRESRQAAPYSQSHLRWISTQSKHGNNIVGRQGGDQSEDDQL